MYKGDLSFCEMITKKDYIDHLQANNVSRYTIRAYDFYLQRWSGFSKNPIIEADYQQIEEFKDYLRTLNLSERTVHQYIGCYRSFFRYARRRGLQVLEPSSLELPKYKKKKIEIMTEFEFKCFFAQFKNKTELDRRNKAIVELLYSTGMRVGELKLLNQLDVQYKERQISIIGKGNIPRLVFLTDRAKNALFDYTSRRKDFFEPLFLAYRRPSSDHRLTVNSIQNIVKAAAKKAGIQKKITPHTLRHQFATNLLRNGADVHSVQLMLGHQSITTTQEYLHLTNTELQKTHRLL